MKQYNDVSLARIHLFIICEFVCVSKLEPVFQPGINFPFWIYKFPFTND